MSSTSTRGCSDRRARVAAIALVVAGAGGCQRPSDPPEVQAARAAVQRYDDRLPAVYRTGDLGRLGDVASEAELTHVGAIVAGLAARGEWMSARLVDLRVAKARLTSPSQVLVDTVETWRYEHRTLSDPERPTTGRERTYEMTYQVGLHEGVWKVEHAGVDAERERREK